MISNMKATVLLRTRVALSEGAFVEMVLWRVPKPVPGSAHTFKYRLAYVVDGRCVIRFDNESGKGDHRHFNSRERPYTFETPEKLIADFQADIARWNNENRHS
jgi:hypothetical protein